MARGHSVSLPISLMTLGSLQNIDMLPGLGSRTPERSPRFSPPCFQGRGGVGLTNSGPIPPQLSPPVLAGLHEIARCVDAGSSEQGLMVHAQVVGCSSFSEVSSFMPVLKSVLTIAHKLHV